jgi:queuine tRNA-ribosyltransferase
MGGLNAFMGWPGPILTDSGGFQVFSLSGSRTRSGRNLVKITDDGVEFSSHIDGKRHFLTPEAALDIQVDLGVDVAVCLDQCLALPADNARILEAVRVTSLWAARTKKHFEKLKKKDCPLPLLHCVVQGGLDDDARIVSAKALLDIGFDGYNVGGLSVGESQAEMSATAFFTAGLLPEDKPRYLMGVGYPSDILDAVRSGIDMFDCVIPSREGRHGRLFVWSDHEEKLSGIGKVPDKTFYKTESIQSSVFSSDNSPINGKSVFPELRNLSKSYLNYLFKIKEPFGMRLATLNNLEFYQDLMSGIRKGIRDGYI